MKSCNKLMYIAVILQSIFTGNTQDTTVVLSPTRLIASGGSGIANFSCVVLNPPAFSAIIILSVLVSSLSLTDEHKRRGIGLIMTNSSAGVVTIDSREENNNTILTCVAGTFNRFFSSSPSVFYVQGVLSPPPSLRIIRFFSSAAGYKRLTWDAPFTLDVPNQEPDIFGYRVCVNFAQTLMCMRTQDTFYDFPNIRLPLDFHVTALNVVGESSPSTILNPACHAVQNPVMINIQVAVEPSLNARTYSMTVQLQYPLHAACFDVYTLELTAPGAPTTDRFGPLFPRPVHVLVVNPLVQTVELEGVSGLQENSIFATRIMAASSNFIDNAMFSTYDVQAVTLSTDAEELTVGCSFLERSLAVGCEITFCMRTDGGVRSCKKIPLQRNNPIMTLRDLEVGTYVITNVAEMERDGRISVISSISMLGVLEAYLSLTSLTTTTEVMITTEIAQTGLNVVSIVGPVVGVLVALLLAVVIIIVVIVLQKKNILRREDNKAKKTTDQRKIGERSGTGLTQEVYQTRTYIENLYSDESSSSGATESQFSEITIPPVLPQKPESNASIPEGSTSGDSSISESTKV